MPVLAKFCGIVIRLLCLGSLGARLHAFYGDSELVINLADLSVIQGDVPERVRDMVLAWARQHQADVLAGWGAHLSGRRGFAPAAACANLG